MSVKEIIESTVKTNESDFNSEAVRLRKEAQTLREAKIETPKSFAALEKKPLPEYSVDNGADRRTKARCRKEYERLVRECKVWNAQVDGLNAELEREYRLKCAEIEAYNADLEARAAALEAQAEKISKEILYTK